MVFTGSRQPPFFNLRGIYRISIAPFFNLRGIYNVIYRISTAPFFNLRGIYRVSTAPLFQFTWYLQCHLQDLGSHPFSIYVVFTGSRQAPSCKCYLHDLCSFALQHLQYLSLYLHVSMLKFT